MKTNLVKFQNHKRIEILTKSLKLIITADSGPRIAFFGKPGNENLLFWDTKNLGRNKWKLMGGHRVWPNRPGADESEENYLPDNMPCSVTKGNNFVTVSAGIDRLTRTQRGMTIKILKDNKISIDNFIKNMGNMLYSGGVWALTCTNPKPGTNRKYIIPLGNDTGWDSFNYVIFRKWAGHTSMINDPQIKLTENMLILTPEGIECKRMIQAHHGIAAMDVPDQGITFIKKVDFDPNGKYPKGCNMAFYVGPDNFMVEMESMGQEKKLLPGEEIHNIETWILINKSLGTNNRKQLIDSCK